MVKMDFFFTEGVLHFRRKVVTEAEVVADANHARFRFGEVAVRPCSRDLVENLVVITDVVDFVEYN